MQRIETLLAEFEHEARTTRKHLERMKKLALAGLAVALLCGAA